MRELVRLAEVREGRARQSMADLLKSRSTLYEASAADTATGAAAQAESEKAPDGSETRPQSSTDANSELSSPLPLCGERPCLEALS